jgi:hypothetical protein
VTRSLCCKSGNEEYVSYSFSVFCIEDLQIAEESMEPMRAKNWSLQMTICHSVVGNDRYDPVMTPKPGAGDLLCCSLTITKVCTMSTHFYSSSSDMQWVLFFPWGQGGALSTTRWRLEAELSCQLTNHVC